MSPFYGAFSPLALSSSARPLTPVLWLQVTERDDRMLMEQLTALEAANKEVAGDTDSEDDEDTGAVMCNRSCMFSARILPEHER